MIGAIRTTAAATIVALAAAGALTAAGAQAPAAEAPGCHTRRKALLVPAGGEVVGELFRMSFAAPWQCSGSAKKPSLDLFNRETLEFIHVFTPEGFSASLPERVAIERDWCQSMEGKIVSETTERIGAGEWRVTICKQRNPSVHSENYFAEREGRVIRIQWSAGDPPQSDRKSVRRVLESFVWTRP